MDEYNRLLKEYSQVNSLSITLIQGRDDFTKYVTEGSGSEGDSLELYKYRISMDATSDLINEIVTSSNSLDTVLQSNAIKNSIPAPAPHDHARLDHVPDPVQVEQFRLHRVVHVLHRRLQFQPRRAPGPRRFSRWSSGRRPGG
jgi:hypothetical protein